MAELGSLVGHTPLLELEKLRKRLGLPGKLFAKLEWYNPTGSCKDRAVLAMLEDAESRGLLKPGGRIIEPTSGNTGISLAAFGAARGYAVTVVMPASMSVERRLRISTYGARTVLTPAEQGMTGAVEKALQLYREDPGSYMPMQFSNPANSRGHFTTTGPEICRELKDKVDAFVAGVGTGGTITGAGSYIKSRRGGARIVAVEPDTSAVLSGAPAGAHGISGIGAGFVPEILDMALLDEIIGVSTENAEKTARLLAKTEGLLSGVSSGAALFAGIQLAMRREFRNKNIVVLLPDGGDRYLSTPLFAEK